MEPPTIEELKAIADEYRELAELEENDMPDHACPERDRAMQEVRKLTLIAMSAERWIEQIGAKAKK